MTYVNTTLAPFIFKNNEVGRRFKQISTKTCDAIKNFSTFLLKGAWGGKGLQFLQKNKLKSEMFNKNNS